MKVTGPQAGSVTPVMLDKIKKASPGAGTDAVQSTVDRVVLSEDATAIEAARKTIAETPDIRQAKVDALRARIAEGDYQVPAEKIAEHLLAEARLAKLSRK